MAHPDRRITSADRTGFDLRSHAAGGDADSRPHDDTTLVVLALMQRPRAAVGITRVSSETRLFEYSGISARQFLRASFLAPKTLNP